MKYTRDLIPNLSKRNLYFEKKKIIKKEKSYNSSEKLSRFILMDYLKM